MEVINTTPALEALGGLGILVVVLTIFQEKVGIMQAFAGLCRI